MHMIYISQGNIPSREANSIQIVKMSQALGSIVDNFELVTQGGLLSYRNRRAFDFFEWYGICHSFPVMALPLKLRMRYPLPEFHRSLLFPFLAVLYARIKSPDVIYTRWSLVARLALSFGIPVLWEWHEPLKGEIFTRPPFSDGRFLGMVTISDSLGRSFIRDNGLPPEKLIFEHDGVDIKNFCPHKEKSEARIDLGILTDRPIVVYCGHLYAHKGIPLIFEVAKEMKHCLFLLVGGLQKDIERSKAECKALGLDNVHCTGFVSHHKIPTFLFSGDVLILPNSLNHSLSETTSPLKLFEYMASKRPIVASALNNISSVLQHKKNALLAKPDDPQSFVKCIDYLLEHPSVGTALANRAYEQVQYFDWDERAKRILGFIGRRKQNTVGCGFRFEKVLSELLMIIRSGLISKRKLRTIRFFT